MARVIASSAFVLDDVYRSFFYMRLWLTLGWRDIRARYRRTVLGPFWTVASAAVLIFSLGGVYSILWKVDISIFLPYFSAGYIVWTLIVANTNESTAAFTAGQDIIRSYRMPYSMHILRVLWRNILVFMHALSVHLVVVLFIGAGLNWNFLLVIPGLALVVLNSLWVGIAIATICTRFRDVAQVVASIMQVMFFVTPIFWQADRISSQPLAELVLVRANPLFHLVDVVRRPLIGEIPSYESYVFLTISLVVGLLAVATLMGRSYRRLSYWL